MYLHGAVAAVILVRSSQTKLKIEFDFADLINLKPDRKLLTVDPGHTEAVYLAPITLGQKIGVGFDLNYK